MNTESHEAEVVRLPLWKECLKDMLSNGVTDGAAYPAEYFERWLKVTRDSIRFSTDISKIRQALERYGFYLQGRGQKGRQFVILARTANVKQCKLHARHATRAQKRAVTLGSNTCVDDMKPDDRRRHEAYTERASNKLVLMMRADAAYAALPAALKRLKAS